MTGTNRGSIAAVPIVLFAVLSTITSPATRHTFREALDEEQWHAHAISLVELSVGEARLPYFFFS